MIVFSQEEATFLLYFNKVPATEVIQTIEKKYNVKISYVDNYVDGKIISLKQKQRTLKQTLSKLSDLMNIDFIFLNERYIIIKEIDKEDEKYEQLSEIIIKSYLTKGISKNKDANYLIKPKQLDILPGLTEADVLESLQELPGVISPNETATGFTVRGGTQDQNQIIWDNINIYHSGHLYGMISPINPYIVKSVTFHNKGTNPRFGDRVSSVIDISSNNKVVTETYVGLGLNAISADVNLETPLIKDKLSILVSFRRSYEDIYETNTFHRLEEKVFQNTQIEDNNISEDQFYFKDYNLKLNYILNETNTFSISTISIDNDLEHNFNDPNNTNSYVDKLDTENEGYSLNWNKTWDKTATQKTTISHSYYNLNYNSIVTENRTQISDFDKSNTIQDTEFSTELSLNTISDNKLNFGYQTSFKNVRYAFIKTTNLAYTLDKNDSKINSHSIFGNYICKNFTSFDFQLGLRTTYYQQLNTFKLEPRLLVIKDLTKNLKFQASGEIRNQIISQIEETVLSDLTLENKLWKLTDGDKTPIINSNQISAGLIFNKNGWSLDFDTYIKKSTGITALSLGFLNGSKNRFRDGKQKVLGTDLYIKKKFNHINTWISYSFTDIKNKYNDINESKYFTASNQIKHALSTSIAYKIDHFQVALGWKWHTGKPYTISNINPNDNSVVFDGINTGKLPNYHRLDLSSVYEFSFSKNSDLKGKVGFSIRNIYNQRNLIVKEYSGNNIPNDPILVLDKYSIRLVPNFLFRINW